MVLVRAVFKGVYWIKIPKMVTFKFLAQIQHVCTLSISVLSSLNEQKTLPPKCILASKYPQNAFVPGLCCRQHWRAHSTTQTPNWIRGGKGNRKEGKERDGREERPKLNVLLSLGIGTELTIC